MTKTRNKSQRKPILYTDKNSKVWEIFLGKDNDGDTYYSPTLNKESIGVACGSVESAIEHIKEYVSKGYNWLTEEERAKYKL